MYNCYIYIDFIVYIIHYIYTYVISLSNATQWNKHRRTKFEPEYGVSSTCSAFLWNLTSLYSICKRKESCFQDGVGRLVVFPNISSFPKFLSYLSCGYLFIVVSTSFFQSFFHLQWLTAIESFNHPADLPASEVPPVKKGWVLAGWLISIDFLDPEKNEKLDGLYCGYPRKDWGKQRKHGNPSISLIKSHRSPCSLPQLFGPWDRPRISCYIPSCTAGVARFWPCICMRPPLVTRSCSAGRSRGGKNTPYIPMCFFGGNHEKWIED